jgi:hypothetical protein
MRRTTLLCLIIILASCSVKTRNAEKAFKYWSGSKPPDEIQMINGEYYRSPHFTLEYKLFLKFKTNRKWFNEFVKYNGLKPDTLHHHWKPHHELPDWFKPDSRYLVYAKKMNDEFEVSRYFIDTLNRICYIYETEGM